MFKKDVLPWQAPGEYEVPFVPPGSPENDDN